MSAEWRVVTSNKPLRRGEAFILRDDVFALKVYKDFPACDTVVFAEWLARQLERAEARKERNEDRAEAIQGWKFERMTTNDGWLVVTPEGEQLYCDDTYNAGDQKVVRKMIELLAP